MTEKTEYTCLKELKRYAGPNSANVEATYNVSGLKPHKSLEGDVFNMSEAISSDSVEPRETPDLGLSQAYRLHKFLTQYHSQETPDLSEQMEELTELGVPVVGAEFHLSANSEVENLEEKLFVLNMAQYQSGSHIPLSTRDCTEGNPLVEIRMNPSYFPVTIANWELMRQLLPIDETSFFLPITPLPRNNRELNGIKSLANIVYASRYEIPRGRIHLSQKTPDRILTTSAAAAAAAGVVVAAAAGGAAAGAAGGAAAAGAAGSVVAAAGVVVAAAAGNNPSIGEHYIGQTQTLRDGNYDLHKVNREINGKIPTQNREAYQLNLYPGFGKVFPEQAYYLSMAYIAPEILETVRKRAGAVSLRKASRMKPKKIRSILDEVNDQTLENPRSRRATELGQEIREAFYLEA